MNKLTILFLAISLAFGGLTYLSTNNVICAIVVFAISIINYFLFIYLKVKRSSLKKERYHLCYSFINTFIVALSIKGTISSAYDSSLMMMNDDFKEILHGVYSLNENEKLAYLKRLFPFHVYSIFLNVVSIWENQGGDILKMSTYLIQETRNIEEYITNIESSSKQSIIEFSVLWIISLSILIILRFSLNKFYSSMIKQFFFVYAIVALFVFVIASIDFMVLKITKFDIKGWSDNEKYI